MVHDDQPGLVEVEHLAEFFRNAKLVLAVARRELPLVAQREKLLGVRLDAARFAGGQPQRRGAENIRDKLEPLAVPGVKVRARTRRKHQLD